jgi:octaprenyl-diphosphate synthase
MNRIQAIEAPVAEEMKAFRKHFRDAMRTDVALLDTITRYIIRRNGKQMRPLFVFLTARLQGEWTAASVARAGGAGEIGGAQRAGYEVGGHRTLVAASLIELLHTATLVHDDVVDESPMRRGFFSIQALWRKKIAVLVGDYLLSRGLLMAVDQDTFDLLKITSQAVREISEGELLQIEKARRLDITEAVYFEIIRRKTASLIAACCACGSAAVGGSEEDVRRMWRFGECVGLAFQIKDDLLDLGDGHRTGKPTGVDIKERKMTLPLIHTLQQVEPSERRRLIRLVKHHADKPACVQEVMDTILRGPGMDYARKRMADYRDEAAQLLTTFPETSVRKALMDLVDYTIERKQ